MSGLSLRFAGVRVVYEFRIFGSNAAFQLCADFDPLAVRPPCHHMRVAINCSSGQYRAMRDGSAGNLGIPGFGESVTYRF